MTATLLEITDLSVRLGGRNGEVTAADGIDLQIRAGEVVALIGESGSGKSVTSSAIAGLLPRGARVSGSVRLHDRELIGLRDKEFRRIRGSGIGTIFQNPATSFDPSFTIGNQLVEFIRHHRRVTRGDAASLAEHWLGRVGIEDATRVLASYPHQLSGGMRQRVMIAVACLPEPDLLIADEPTTALDPTLSVQILELIDDLRSEFGIGVLLVTHDFGVVARLSDRVAVLRDGRVVESGTTGRILDHPIDDYTRRLIASVPTLRLAPAPSRQSLEQTTSAVRAAGVEKRFAPGSGGRRREFTALDTIDLTLAHGHSVGLIGESGSGKSTLARILAGVDTPSTGIVSVRGTDGRMVDVCSLTPRERARTVQLVFQDHGSALNPRVRVGEQIARPLRRLGATGSRVDVRAGVTDLLEQVGLDPELAQRHPHQLSGGQRQRVGIARALAARPSVIILDEPTSALDVTTQAEILDLLRTLRSQTRVTYILISHDLAVVRSFVDDIVVLDHGRIVDRFDAAEPTHPDRHPVTRRLVNAVADISSPAAPRSMS